MRPRRWGCALDRSFNAWQVLAANGVDVMLALNDEFTPTPALSHAILVYNRGHVAPHDTGLADQAITHWIETQANRLLQARLEGVQQVPLSQALRVATTHRHDFLNAYTADLGSVIDMDAIRAATLRIGVDPMGGAGVHYWRAIAEHYRLDLTVISEAVDPTFTFMPLDWDGQIRMDPSSPHAMQGLVAIKNRFDIAFACDTAPLGPKGPLWARRSSAVA